MAESDSIVKLCECGCGSVTPISDRTDAKRGKFKGQPCRFKTGHYAGKRDHNRRELPEKFWRRVTKGQDCWQWTGARSSDGYGSVQHLGRNIGAHRVSYLINVGEIPPGVHVLHNCDNPSCVNPSHLRLGTHTDNMRDKSIRNRHPRAGAKLTETQVVAIRMSKNTDAELANLCGVNIEAIRKIRAGKTWKLRPASKECL